MQFRLKHVGLLTLLFALLFTLGACASNKETGTSTLDQIKQRDKLIAGVKYDTRLFGYKDPNTGQVEGFDVDIAKALAKKFSVMKTRSS